MRISKWVFVSFGTLLAVVACASVSGGGDWAFARDTDDGELNWGACPELFPAGCQLAVLHGDPAEPGADIFFRIPGGYSLPRHRHTSAERMVLVAGELHLRYDGRRNLELAAGTYAYGPAGLAHAGRCVGEDPCVLFIAFDGPIDSFAVADDGS